MHTQELFFLQDLALIMLIAACTTIICQRLKQPLVLGYLIAGVIVGPYILSFFSIHDEATIRSLAELGVIFLMFSLGLEFDLHKLSKVGFAAFIAAFIEIVFMIWLGFKVGMLFDWTTIDAIFLGAILAISSTTIIVKALEELKMKNDYFAQFIFGILVIEDIFAIAILALLSSITLNGPLNITSMLITGAKLSTFLVASLCIGLLSVPRLLNYINKFNNKEIMLVVVLGLSLGFCWIVATLNYSVALGAFLIGVIIAESSQRESINELIDPLTKMFSAIFFVSVGLLFNPRILLHYTLPIIVITCAVVLGKMASCGLGMFFMGKNGKMSIKVGLGLSQIGEFSFIIASLGLTLHLTSDFLYPIAVAVSVITTFLTPYFIKYSDKIASAMNYVVPRPAANLLSQYTQWAQHMLSSKPATTITRVVHHSLIQIIINLFIVSAVFFIIAYFFNYLSGHFFVKNIHTITMKKTFYWGAALLIALPFLVAIYGKVKALTMIGIEAYFSKHKHNAMFIRICKLISEAVPGIFILGTVVFVSILNTDILPPIKIMLVIMLLMLIIVGLLYAWFVKIHSKLQITLIETFKKDKH